MQMLEVSLRYRLEKCRRSIRYPRISSNVLPPWCHLNTPKSRLLTRSPMKLGGVGTMSGYKVWASGHTRNREVQWSLSEWGVQALWQIVQILWRWKISVACHDFETHSMLCTRISRFSTPHLRFNLRLSIFIDNITITSFSIPRWHFSYIAIYRYYSTCLEFALTKGFYKSIVCLYRLQLWQSRVTMSRDSSSPIRFRSWISILILKLLWFSLLSLCVCILAPGSKMVNLPYLHLLHICTIQYPNTSFPCNTSCSQTSGRSLPDVTLLVNLPSL